MRGVAILAALALAIWACTVNTKTDKLACKVQTDCSGGRVCEAGYCVIDPNARLDGAIDGKAIDAAVCPASCDSCDFPTSTCNITGTGNAVSCPTGWKCNITCATAGACSQVTCNTGACAITCATPGACGAITCNTGDCTIGCTTGSGSGSGSMVTSCGPISCNTGACDVTCTGAGACQTLTCGLGKCHEDCEGAGACGNTSCAASCKCDVTCNPLLGACGTMSCPMHGSKICTTGMVSGAACNSQVAQQCHTCP